MNDPKNPNQEPRRTSQPNPGETPPVQAPKPQTSEYEKEVPHQSGQPIAHTGTVGEGSYEGTRKYEESMEKFSQQTSPEESVRKAKAIDPEDASLREAEQRGKSGKVPRRESLH